MFNGGSHRLDSSAAPRLPDVGRSSGGHVIYLSPFPPTSCSLPLTTLSHSFSFSLTPTTSLLVAPSWELPPTHPLSFLLPSLSLFPSFYLPLSLYSPFSLARAHIHLRSESLLLIVLSSVLPS